MDKEERGGLSDTRRPNAHWGSDARKLASILRRCMTDQQRRSPRNHNDLGVQGSVSYRSARGPHTYDGPLCRRFGHRPTLGRTAICTASRVLAPPELISPRRVCCRSPIGKRAERVEIQYPRRLHPAATVRPSRSLARIPCWTRRSALLYLSFSDLLKKVWRGFLAHDSAGRKPVSHRQGSFF